MNHEGMKEICNPCHKKSNAEAESESFLMECKGKKIRDDYDKSEEGADKFNR